MLDSKRGMQVLFELLKHISNEHEEAF